jgi:hypothetical protein
LKKKKRNTWHASQATSRQKTQSLENATPERFGGTNSRGTGEQAALDKTGDDDSESIEPDELRNGGIVSSKKPYIKKHPYIGFFSSSAVNHVAVITYMGPSLSECKEVSLDWSRKPELRGALLEAVGQSALTQPC